MQFWAGFCTEIQSIVVVSIESVLADESLPAEEKVPAEEVVLAERSMLDGTLDERRGTAIVVVAAVLLNLQFWAGFCAGSQNSSVVVLVKEAVLGDSKMAFLFILKLGKILVNTSLK